MADLFLVGDWRVIAMVPLLVIAAGFFMVMLAWYLYDLIYDDGARFGEWHLPRSRRAHGRHDRRATRSLHAPGCYYSYADHPLRTCHGKVISDG